MTTSQIRIRYGSRMAAWVFLAVMSGTAKADYRQGVEAYKHSDYQRALSEVRPLAEIGDAHSQARFASYQGTQPWFGELIPM